MTVVAQTGRPKFVRDQVSKFIYFSQTIRYREKQHIYKSNK